MALGELEPARRRPVGEQPRPLAPGEGEDEQVQVVDEPVGEHRAHQGAAARHEHVAVRLVAEAGDGVGGVGAEDAGVAPVLRPAG